MFRYHKTATILILSFAIAFFTINILLKRRRHMNTYIDEAGRSNYRPLLSQGTI